MDKYGSSYSIAHPDFDKLDAEGAALDTGRIIALYPSGAALEKVGFASRGFRQVIYATFRDHGLELQEIFPQSLIDKAGLIDGRVALRAVHFPKSRDELRAAITRLRYEELFFFQLYLAIVFGRRKKEAGPRFDPPGELTQRFIEEVLPFELTNAQKNVIGEIAQDTTGDFQMNRLVQGDVGSGKTVVAVAAMMHALDSGFQSAFMAPTEILAEQHYANLMRYFEPLGVKVRLLIGG